MAVLAVRCRGDGVLGTVAPLALAAAAGSALVVDLDPAGPRYPGAGSLAQLVADGPRRSDLHPEMNGVAVLRNGGVGPTDAAEVIAALVESWPRVVLRLPTGGGGDWPLVPVVPLLPGGLTEPSLRPAVYQQIGWRLPAPGPALTLPMPSRATVNALCEGRLPAGSSWIRRWRRVWELPWA
jgi:hypothetical protein